MFFKMGKPALVVLIISLVVFLAVSHVMYAKVNENTMTQIVQQQSLDTNRLINLIYAKQNELDALRNKLENANIKIATLSAAATAPAGK